MQKKLSEMTLEELLKLSLWKLYEHDRDGYTNAKLEFVTKHTQTAKEKYKDNYL